MPKRIFSMILALVLLLAHCSCAQTVRGNLEERFSDRLKISYEGSEYRLRSRLTTILLAGIDQRSESYIAPGEEYRSGGQADFQLLVVIDDNNDCVYTIQINRDTMTEITILNVLGQVAGTRTAQICLAHSFGDGGRQSCELLCDAVSKLMMGVPVDHYIAMNLDGISVLNDAIGGVTVTLEDDFSVYDPAMKAGETLTLAGRQAEIFVRSRIAVGDQTNLSRLERQKQYIRAAVSALEAQGASYGKLEAIVDAVTPYLTTDLSRGRMINLADSLRSYETKPIVSISGEAVLGAHEVMEFYPDVDSLIQAVLDACFEKCE